MSWIYTRRERIPMKNLSLSLIAILMWASLLSAQPQLPEKSAKANASAGIDLIWAFKIPMRDGVRLNGTVFKPTGQKEPLPVIFTLTPYISDSYRIAPLIFRSTDTSSFWWMCAGEAIRRATSTPSPRSRTTATTSWSSWPNSPGAMAKSPCGEVHTWLDQWGTLKELPPHLATIVPAAAAHAGVDFPFFKGIWTSHDMQWLTFISGKTGNANLFDESSFWIQKFREMYLGQRPLTRSTRSWATPRRSSRNGCSIPTYDSYWQALALTPEQYAKMSVPILTITGDYDGDQPGAMAYYREHMKYGNAETKAKHYLIIGPDHPGTRTPTNEVGGLTFGDASLLDMNDLHRQWYDWTLKNGPKPEFLKKRVAYYVVGRERKTGSTPTIWMPSPPITASSI